MTDAAQALREIVDERNNQYDVGYDIHVQRIRDIIDKHAHLAAEPEPVLRKCVCGSAAHFGRSMNGKVCVGCENCSIETKLFQLADDAKTAWSAHIERVDRAIAKALADAKPDDDSAPRSLRIGD